MAITFCCISGLPLGLRLARVFLRQLGLVR